MIRRSRSSTRRARARAGGPVSSGPVLATTPLIIGPGPAGPVNPRPGPAARGAGARASEPYTLILGLGELHDQAIELG